MRPRFSFVVPFRDAGATLGASLASIQASRGPSWEAVLIDDGSGDEGPAIAAGFAARDPRFRLVRRPPRGLVSALNLGLAAARAPWIARLDADDLTEPGRLIAQAAVMEAEPEARLIGGGVRFFPEDEVAGGLRRYAAWLNSLTGPAELRRDLFVESPIAHPAALFHRLTALRLGAYRDGPFPEDYDLWLRFWEAGYGMASAPQRVLSWRHHSGRLTFLDPRYSPDAFRRLKAEVLARTLLAGQSEIAIAGAGRDGKRWSRCLAGFGLSVRFWLDLDPRKLGQRIHGAPVLPYRAVPENPPLILAAVGVAGARAIIRATLDGLGLIEERDYICVA